MKQYFLCPKCKKRLIKSGREQFMCKKCKSYYRVPNYQRIAVWFANTVIVIAMIAGFYAALSRL